MNALKSENAILAGYLPGLAEKLAGFSLGVLEGTQGPAIREFRESGGPALLVPCEYGGLGASPVQAVQVQRAIGALAPSLAVASTMHHFSVAVLGELALSAPELGTVLRAIANNALLVASGFAEGRSGQGVLAPTLLATRDGGDFILNGSKKPCSLSASMSILTASVRVESDGRPDIPLAVALVPADTPGLERRPFWKSPVLAAAESDEIVLREVRLSAEQLIPLGDGSRLDAVQVRGLIWFQTLISGAYLGVTSALVERMIAAGKGEAADRTLAAAEVEGAMAALEGVAHRLGAGACGEEDLARALLVRYSVQQAITRASATAAEALGGLAFLTSPDVALLLATTRALAFHPPARATMSRGLADYLAGKPLAVR